jgi:hypothetical protein
MIVARADDSKLLSSALNPTIEKVHLHPKRISSKICTLDGDYSQNLFEKKTTMTMGVTRHTPPLATRNIIDIKQNSRAANTLKS